MAASPRRLPEGRERVAESPKPGKQPTVTMQGPVCPVPLRHAEQIVLGHGSGGSMTHTLVRDLFYAAFDNAPLLAGDDSAMLDRPGEGRLALTTDSHIVAPLFFPGGDIGRLAVCGTVNDLAMVGAQPLGLTAGFILEEGLLIATLQSVIESMRLAAEEAGIRIVAGDTKVVERGKGDGVFINTSGLGWVPAGREISGRNAQAGDVVLLTGPIGDHGIAVLTARGGLALESDVRSDVAPLNRLVEALLSAFPEVHVLRDPTRGGVATALNEIARQSGVAIQLDEVAIPVNPSVESACELLGLDPLYVANEGKALIVLPVAHAQAALQLLRSQRYGEGSVQIGVVREAPAGRVLMRTAIGGTRVVDTLAGEMLPRIC
jgi:hydrogenase expression/formation protein HypE